MLNWKIRYSAILRRHPELFNPTYSVVEVGCGNFGIALYLNRPVIGVEPLPGNPASPHLRLIEGSATSLPFDDRSVDFVVSVDMIEHLSPEVREVAINELIRVSRRAVIISCPCHIWARDGEVALKTMFEKSNMPVPGWLLEHFRHGVPMINELLEPIAASGFKFEVLGNETILQHYSGIAMDWWFPLAGQANERLQRKSINRPPIEGNEWDVYYSFNFNIFKERRYDKRLGGIRNPRREIVPEDTAPKLYAVYHTTDFPSDHLGGVTSIFCGPAAKSVSQDSLTDSLFHGGGLENSRWSELSAIYRVWKEGPRSQIVGFSHYRRLFDFGRAAEQAPSRQTVVAKDDLASHTHRLFDEYFLRSLRSDSLIVAPPLSVGSQSSIFDQYCDAHNTNDYLHILSQIGLSNGPLLEGILEQFHTPMLYANNLFITTWPLFCELCELMFSYLGRFAHDFPDRKDAAPYNRRDIAFLSERIFDAWVRCRIKSNATTVTELPILFVEKS